MTDVLVKVGFLALAALNGSQDCVNDMKKIMQERCEILCEGLDQLNIPYSEPQGGYYVYADVSKTGLSATDFCLKLFPSKIEVELPLLY